MLEWSWVILAETGTQPTSEGTWQRLERLGGARESSKSQGVETSVEEVIKPNQVRCGGMRNWDSPVPGQPRLCSAICLDNKTKALGMTHTCNPNVPEAEARELEIQGHLWLGQNKTLLRRRLGVCRLGRRLSG